MLQLPWGLSPTGPRIPADSCRTPRDSFTYCDHSPAARLACGLHFSLSLEGISMRKLLALVIGALLVGAVVTAQTHNNMIEKKVSDEITIPADVKVGTHILKAGDYRVSCDTKTITFSLITVRSGRDSYLTKVLEAPCEGKELAARRENTELVMPNDTDGVPVLEKLYLRGSNIEHVFPN
jgi:hypothetical protein